MHPRRGVQRRHRYLQLFSYQLNRRHRLVHPRQSARLDLHKTRSLDTSNPLVAFVQRKAVLFLEPLLVLDRRRVEWR